MQISSMEVNYLQGRACGLQQSAAWDLHLGCLHSPAGRKGSFPLPCKIWRFKGRGETGKGSLPETVTEQAPEPNLRGMLTSGQGSLPLFPQEGVICLWMQMKGLKKNLSFLKVFCPIRSDFMTLNFS